MEPSQNKPNKWERFLALKKKRQAICQSETKDDKQKDDKQTESMTSAEQSEISEKADSSGLQSDARECVKSDQDDSAKPSANAPEAWARLQGYMGAHDHLRGIQRGSHAAKTSLEEKVDEAISRGDFELAEKLSDQVSDRQLGLRITDAIDAQNFDRKRKVEEENIKAKKKKKLKWGFEHKEKWEMKANM